MTDAEALAEARRRWGAEATVTVDLTTCFEFHLVGVEDSARGVPLWHGTGRSWELAFAAADVGAASVTRGSGET